MTQIQQIETHLLQYGTITAWEAIQLYRITCLNKMIQLLKTKYLISGVWQKHNKKHFKIYKLEGAK